MQKIDELRLPEDLVDEPFYLIHFIAGYSYYDQGNYKEALPHFEAALRRHGGSPNEIADLQFYTGVCDCSLVPGQKDMTAKVQEAIGLFEKAAKAYEGVDQMSWAITQENLGAAYAKLPTGDPTANLQMAIAAYQAAMRVTTEKDFPVDWAIIQNDLGNAYNELPTGDRAANLQMAIAAFQAALRVAGEKDFPGWVIVMIQNNLGAVYAAFPTGDHAADLQMAIAAYQAGLRVASEKDFPIGWAAIQANLGRTYAKLPTGNRAANLKSAKACLEAALRVYTENEFPDDRRAVVEKLADVELQLRSLTGK